jgi:hypothetical protein
MVELILRFLSVPERYGATRLNLTYKYEISPRDDTHRISSSGENVPALSGSSVSLVSLLRPRIPVELDLVSC